MKSTKRSWRQHGNLNRPRKVSRFKLVPSSQKGCATRSHHNASARGHEQHRQRLSPGRTDIWGGRSCLRETRRAAVEFALEAAFRDRIIWLRGLVRNHFAMKGPTDSRVCRPTRPVARGGASGTARLPPSLMLRMLPKLDFSGSGWGTEELGTFPGAPGATSPAISHTLGCQSSASPRASVTKKESKTA